MDTDTLDAFRGASYEIAEQHDLEPDGRRAASLLERIARSAGDELAARSWARRLARYDRAHD